MDIILVLSQIILMITLLGSVYYSWRSLQFLKKYWDYLHKLEVKFYRDCDDLRKDLYSHDHDIQVLHCEIEGLKQEIEVLNGKIKTKEPKMGVPTLDICRPNPIE